MLSRHACTTSAVVVVFVATAAIVNKMPVHRNLAYVDEHPHGLQTLDIFIPEENLPTNGGVVVIVHGGAWRSGSREEYTELASQVVHNLKYPAVLVDYRLSPEHQHPCHLNDVQSALRFILNEANINRYGYVQKETTPQLVLLGHSCGATLISQIALSDPDIDKNVAVYMGIEGIYDIPDLLEEYPDYMSFIQPAFGSETPPQQKASPTYMANKAFKHEKAKPFVLVHTHQDELLTPRQTLGFKKALEASNDWIVSYNDSLTGKHFEAMHTRSFFTFLGQMIASHL